VLWLHTFGDRFVPRGSRHAQVPRGRARCTKSVPGAEDGYPEFYDYNDTTQKLRIGLGEFCPISAEVYTFEVSGMRVVESWLKYRMKQGAGKKSSPLDKIRPISWRSQDTTELLELLWVLEATIDGYAEQADLLYTITTGSCFTIEELPAVPDKLRKPPGTASQNHNLFDNL
jgi:hypothetical protein